MESLLIRALGPFMRVPPSSLNHVLKTPLPTILTLSVRIPTHELKGRGGDTNIQSIILNKYIF